MSKNNKQNSSCGFAEELISYLYDEINSEDRAKFEKHLSHCSNCNDETAVFGSVRSSIVDWRDEVFLAIEPPQIEIPYLTKKGNVESNTAVSISWFERLQHLFTQTPILATASAAAAILAVLLGSAFFVLNYSNDVERAEIPGGIEINGANSDPVKQTPVQTEISKTEEIRPEISGSENQIIANSPPKQNEVKASKVSNKSKTLDKLRIKPNDSTLAKVSVIKNNKSNPDSKKVVEIPNLSNLAEDDKDDSLRLADLFDEVGSKK